jgi:glycerol uptake facilitator protein
MRTQALSTAELCAEFAGTTLLMLFGLGVEAQTATAVPAGSMGGHDAVTWAWGIGVTIACYVAARLSGAHLNPAVTLALAVCNGFPWRKVAGYIGAQMAGGALAAVIVRVLYQDLIARVDPGFTSATQTVFSTSPGPGVSLLTALFDQVLGTAILVFVVCALTATTNNPPLANLEPVVVGLLVVVIGMSWGANAGYAINPARDLPPRLVSWLTGYQTAWVDLNGDPYWWVPVIGPLVGGLVGAGLFRVAIARHLPPAHSGVDPFAGLDPRLGARAHLVDQLAAAREEATVAANKARLAAERAHELETGYARLAASATAHGWLPGGPSPMPPPASPPPAQQARPPRRPVNGHTSASTSGPVPVHTSTIRGL